MELSHGGFIRRMEGSGYKADHKGMCHGIAMMAVQAIVIGQFYKFQKRISLLSKFRSKNIGDKINEARESMVENEQIPVVLRKKHKDIIKEN